MVLQIFSAALFCLKILNAQRSLNVAREELLMELYFNSFVFQ